MEETTEAPTEKETEAPVEETTEAPTEKETEAPKAELSGETRKIYYYNVEFWDEVWAAWSFDEEDFEDVTHPGKEMNSNTELENVWYITVPVEVDEVLFSDGIEVTETLLEQERLAGLTVTHEIEVRLGSNTYYNMYTGEAWLNYADEVAAKKAAEATEPTEPPTEAPTEPSEVEKVQAMINALPTSFTTQAEVDNFWDVTAADLDAAIEALTPEQQEQLNTARYDEAIDAAASFANPEFDDWTTWGASNITEATSSENPYVIEFLDGKYTKKFLYDILDDNGNYVRFAPLGSDVTKGTQLTTAFGNDGTVEHEQIYQVQNGKGAMGITRWYDTIRYFKALVYHNITATLAADSDANATGGGVTATGKVYHDQPATITVTDVDGYKAELYNGETKVAELNDTAGWTYTIEKATDSVAYTVKYVSEAATEYNVTIKEVVNNEFANSVVTLGSDKGIAGATVAVNIDLKDDTNSAKYGYVVTASGTGASVNGNVVTIGTSDVEVTVTFTKTAIQFGEGSSTVIPFNGGKTAAEQMYALRQNIFNTLKVESLPAGVSLDDVTVQYEGNINLDAIDNDGVKGFAQGIADTLTDNWYEVGTANPVYTLNAGLFGTHDLVCYSFAAKGLSDTETIRIYWGDLYVETDITFAESRETYQVKWTDPKPAEPFENMDAVKAAVQKAVNAQNPGKSITVGNSANEMPGGNQTGPLTFPVTVADDAGHLGSTNQTVTITVTAKSNPSTLTVEQKGDTGEVLIDGYAPGTTLSAGSNHTIKVTPSDLDGSNGKVTYVESVKIGEEVISGNYNNGVFEGSFSSENDTAYTITVQYATAELKPQEKMGTLELNGYVGKTAINTDDYSARWENIDAKTLKAVLGVDATEGYAVSYWINPSWNAAEGYYSADNSYVKWSQDRLAVPAYDEIGSLNVKIVKAASSDGKIVDLTLETTVKTKESREYAVAVAPEQPAASFDTKELFLAALKEATTVKDAKGNEISRDNLTLTAEWNGKVATVTWTVGENQNWLETTGTLGSYTWTVSQYTVTWYDEDGTSVLDTQSGIDYGTVPVYSKATPTKESSVSENFTFSSWEVVENVNNEGKITGNASYKAVYTAAPRSYVVKYVNEDGTVRQENTVEYGNAIPAYDSETSGVPTKGSDDPEIVYTHSGWDLTEGTEGANGTVASDLTYKAKFSRDTIHSVTFKVDNAVYGEVQYINVTKNPNAVVQPVADPDKDHAIFAGWDTDIIGKTPTTNVVVTAKWTEESNNNNVPDAEETININVAEGGSITINNKPVVNGDYVFDTKNNSYTIVITPPMGKYVDSLTIGDVEYANTHARTAAVRYDNGVMTITDVALTDGSKIKAAFAKHSIPAVEAPEMLVNGHINKKLATVTKKGVLEAVLDKTLTDAEVEQYDVKMYVNLGEIFGYTIDGYYNIWDVADILNGIPGGNLVGELAESTINSAISKAIDVGGSETFEITWKAHDKYPEVKDEYSVKLVEKRQPTTVTHNGGDYVASELDETLLEKIQNNLTTNTTIIGKAWAEPKPELVPGTKVENVIVFVTVSENEEYYCKEPHEIAVTIDVPANDIEIKILETAELTFNTGMSDTDKVAMLKEKVPYTVYVKDTTTEVTDAVEKNFAVEYLASTARNVPYTVNIAQLDLGIAGSFLPDTIEVEIPVEELWLPMSIKGNDFPVYEAPSNELIKDILLNDLIPNYAADYIAGNISNEKLKEIASDLLAKHPDVANYYKYMGAHQFGELESETIRYVVDLVVDEKEHTKRSNECVLSMVDNRHETEILLNTGVAVTYNSYTESELLAMLVKGVQSADGSMVEGATVTFVTDVEGLSASESATAVVKFAGNENYKPSEATATFAINKAEVTVSVDNRLIKWQDGLTYNLPVVTNPAGVDTINFIAGLNVEGANVNNGFKGFVAQIQLMLPEELQELLGTADSLLQGAGLNISFANGASMKLSELKGAVDALDNLFAGSEYEEYFRVLLNMLTSLPTETADIEIIIGGSMPTDIGAYVVGAISADANYTTDFGVGAVVIYPDGIKAELAWNMTDDNFVITNTLLANGTFDAGAHAVSVGQGGTIEGANEQIAEIFLGMDIDGTITIEMDQTKIDVGAYVEVAMTADWGNSMYYSVPLVRPIVVVAESLNVDFLDDNGNINNERHYQFFNVPQNGMEGNLKITYKQGDKAGQPFDMPYTVKFFYVGAQTNAVPYASETAPTHAGAYTITAVVVARNGDMITHAGQGIGALVIEPSKSTTTVENEAIKWNGAEHKVNNFVTATSVNVPSLKPDTTIISAGVSADLNADIGLDAIQGNVNVDMPSWMDELLKKLNVLEAGYNDGITADVFLSYIEKLEAELVKLGVETDAFTKIVDVVKQLPAKTTLTFHDDKGYSEVGVYLVIGIVTDSDHYPSADAGVMIIYPNATKVELRFNETWDNNNVFSQAYLKNYDLDAQAYALNAPADAQPLDVAPGKVVNLFVGFADHGELEFTSNKLELDNGIYAQVSFIWDLSNSPYYAEPISREVIIVPNNAKIEFVGEDGNVNNERHFQFNNQTQGMDKIRVTLADGTVLDLTAEDDRVAIYYLGVQTNGMPYASYEAPVHAGAYEVTAQYTDRDAQGRVMNLGIGVGAMVIEPSKSETSVDNAAYPHGGKHHVGELVHVSSVNVPGLTPDSTVISAGLSADLSNITGLNAINGTVNIDLPAWFDEVMDELNVLEAGYADGISADVFLSYANKIREGLKKLEVDTASFDEIVSFVEQLPINTNLTFEDNIGYTEVGAYLVVAVVTDSDHYPSIGAGVMVIHPNATKVELQFEEDWNDNNIFTWYALQNMNLEAKAYLNGAYCEPADKKVVNLYFGFADNGKFLLDAVTYGQTIKDVPEFRNGAYTQLALVQDLGNDMYYAKPISRNFVIVPTPAMIEFVDDNGNVNADRHFIFNNQPQGMKARVTIAGAEATDLSGLTVTYVGVQTNGEFYNSTTAPTHSGAYTVTAAYTARDEHNRLVTLGAAVGAMVIEPAKSTMDVQSKLHEYDNTPVATNDMVKSGSVVTGLTPDKTIITAAISTDGTFSENALSAVTGAVNVDFPAWVDNILTQYAPSIYNGMKAGEFNAKLMAKLESFVADAETVADEYDIPADKLIDALNAALAEVEEIVEQLPADVVLTFKNQVDVAPVDVGTYLIVGIVTDSDHYPSADVGVLVIYPKVTKAKLDWFYKDMNGIITLPALKNIDMSAIGIVDGAEDESVTAMIDYLTVGIDENGELIMTNLPNNLTSNGAYTEVAYIPVEIGAQMTVAAPIIRSFVVVPQTVTVEVTDMAATYGETYEVPVEVIDMNNNAITGDRLTKNLKLTYIGVNASTGLYNSTVKPTNSGIYTVVATYVEKNDSNEHGYIGMGIGTLTISAADATVNVENEIHVFDGQKVDVTSLITSDPADAKLAILTAALNLDGDFSEDGILAVGTSVNIDFPARADEIIRKYLPEGYTVQGISLNPFYQILDKISEELIEAGFDADAVDYLKTQLKQLPENAVLTFKEQEKVNPSAIGVYLIGAVVMDPDYIPAADAGLLVIANDLTLAQLKWNYRDSNNIITRAVIADMDMAASAYVQNVYNAENTNRIDYIIMGAGANGNVVLTNNPADIKYLPNGVYTEIAYIYQNIDATMTLATPIQRTFAIVEDSVDVIIEDANVEYDGNCHPVNVTVLDKNKNEIDCVENLTVTYINLISGYYSTTAPTNVGSYTVIAKYEEIINGQRGFFGMEIGNVTITPTNAEFILNDKTVVCGAENAVASMVTNTSNIPYAIYIIKNAENSEINVILPAGWKITLDIGATVEDLIAALEELPAAIENAEMIQVLKSALNSIDLQKLSINGEQPSAYGKYEVTAIAFGDLNYKITKASAMLTIEHAGDQDTDHDCDVCGEVVYGEHADSDKNHSCDYGCSEPIGEHADSDKNHSCDYGCSEPIGEHVDASADGDHVCDYGCGETLTECVDTNNDHKCDDCGAVLNNGMFGLVMNPDDSDTIVPGATIYVDGVAYELDENYTAWIDPEEAKSNALVTTYRYKNGTTANETYPTNMYVWYMILEDSDADGDPDGYHVERIPELDNFFQYNGTSIRVGSAKNGIRFFTSIAPDARAKLQNGTLIESGSLKNAKMVRAGTVFKKNPTVKVTLENGVSSDVYGGEAGSEFRVFGTYDGRNWYTGMLVGLDTDAATVTAGIAARPYAQLQIGDETVVLYGGQIERSIYYVACQNQNTFAAGSAYDNFVEGLIAKGNSAN